MRLYKTILFSLLPLFIFSQNRKTFGHVGVQYQEVDFSDFNAQAAELGFAGLNNNIAEFTGGALWFQDRWKSTLALSLGFTGEDGDLNNQTVRYEYAGAAFGTAYNLLRSTERWYLGPEITVQFRGEQAVLGERGAVSGIANVNQASFIKLSRIATPVELGLNGHWSVDYGQDQVRRMLMSLRIGYRFDGDQTDWKVDQAIAIENNGINIQGVYAALTFSFGFN